MYGQIETIVTSEQKGKRLDQLLTGLPQINRSRSAIKKMIDDGLVEVNGQVPKSGYQVKIADRIKVTLPPPVNPAVKPENIPLEIVYEDDAILVVNKPRGMVVHPAPGNYTGTLVNGLLFHGSELAPTGNPLRPGIVHRLDKDTSGLLVIAKTAEAYASLLKQFKERMVEKTYLALVHGETKKEEGLIESGIGRHPVNRKKMAVLKGARTAITRYSIAERFSHYTLLAVKIKTGRTHQIRVHLNHIGYPIVGDPTYGRKKEAFAVSGQLLHAGRLSFIHPVTNKRVEFKAQMPPEMAEVIKKLRNG